MRVRRFLSTFAICSILLANGCAKSRPKATPPAAAAAGASSPARATTSVARLQQELAAMFDNPSINAIWAVQVQSFDTGEILYERNAHTLVMPASNMKLVTMSVAASRLGWDFRFATRLATDGIVANGTLTGDLIVIGGGDPTISDRGGDPTRVFQSWADQLRAQGITHITGRIIGDDDTLDDRQLGDGWAWDDLVFGYSTPGGALQYNEDIVKATIRPAATAGQPATITLEPAGSGLTVRNLVTTVAGSTGTGTSTNVSADISMSRRPGSAVLEIAGSIPVGGREMRREAAVENPTQFFVNALRETLVRKGITVDGAAVDIDDLKAGDAPSAAPDAALAPDKRQVLFTHQSPPLASEEVATTFMKVSQNLFGETLMATIGALAPRTAENQHQRPVEAARKIYEDTLASWGVPPAEHIIVDGSGLSRYNYITANLIVHILRAMARDPKYAATFEALLPIAGKDGTLRNRMKGTKAEGNVHAKTGTLMSVRSLSGYLRTADNERIGFSIIANNFKAPTAAIDNVAELAVERLSNFTRAATAPAAPLPAAR